MAHKICIIDDDREHAETLKSLLSRKGFEVETFFDALSCFVALPNLNPDVVITDYNMPQINGHEFIKEFRNVFRTRTIPIILLSGFLSEEVRDEVSSEQSVHLVEKPLPFNKLLALLNEILASPGKN